MTTSETALLDSNILIYADQEESPFHSQSKALRNQGLKGEVSLCVCPQVLYEFFAVVTDPRRVTLPVSPREAMAEVEKYYRAKWVLKIYPGRDLLERMVTLFTLYPVRRQGIFDLQLVATMLSNGVTKLYTYNEDHFSRFKEIEVLKP